MQKNYFEKAKNGLSIEDNQYIYRWFFIPFLIVGLHHFEKLTYGVLSMHYTLTIQSLFMLFISSLICLVVYALTLDTGPKWQQILYKACLLLVLLNIMLGFFNRYYKRDNVVFTEQDKINIEKQDATYLEGLKLLDTSKAFVVGKYLKRQGKLLGSSTIKVDSLTYDEQFKIYAEHLLPKDFRAYWKFIDTSGNSTERSLIGDYYDWQYPDYKIYICQVCCVKTLIIQ